MSSSHPIRFGAIRAALLALFACTTLPHEIDAAPKIYRDAVRPHWSEDGDRFWYRNDLAGGVTEFILVDAVSGTRRLAFDRGDVAARLTGLTGEEVDPDRLPVEALDFAGERGSLLLLGVESAWLLEGESGEITPAEGSAGVEGLPFDWNERPSGHTGTETHVTFVNRLDIDVQMWWVDGSGGRHPYARLAPGERFRQHTFAGHIWVATDAGDSVLAVFEAIDDEAVAIMDGRDFRGEEDTPDGAPVTSTAAGPEHAGVHSPDSTLAVFVRADNLWLRDLSTGAERRLSFDGSDGDSYRMDGQRARLIEMEYDAAAPSDSTPDIYWSPDSRYLIAMKTRTVAEREVHMIESSPRDALYPAVQSYPYLKPGDDIPVPIPHLFDAQSVSQLPLDADLFPEPWEISQLHWRPDGSRVYFLYNERGHQAMRVIGVQPATGETWAIVDERCATFFDYQGKTFLEQIDSTDELIWMSERDGWNHLYLYDRKRGRVKNQITRGEWVVRGVDRVDVETRRIYFRACGIEPAQDPYFIHHCRVDFSGDNLVVLTEGDGTHRVDWSPDNRFLIDTWSRVDRPPVHVLRRASDGALICTLETADISELVAEGVVYPESFRAKGRDGATDIYGIIHRPADFDERRQYPVIENIYAGPHGQHVPKSFRTRYSQRALADLGFIVVQIDGMGTNWRSKSFHDVAWQNLVDAGLLDRVAWIEAAARRYPQMDLSRVGIYGGSAGGQNALAALLTHGDFYKVAVADCGCHDNRMDKIWWNEQWMGYPVGPHYAEQSNVTLAGNLSGKLLLIVGELDRNVDPASTMQVVDALIRADRDFDMLVIPGVGHGAAGTAYGARRLRDFFVEHLLEGDSPAK